MSPPQGLADFPGVNQLLGASITIAHGTSPNSATLTIAPQAGFATEVGMLRFTFAGTTIEFPNCKVDYTSFARNSNGEI
jgi:hypothetical protein